MPAERLKRNKQTYTGLNTGIWSNKVKLNALSRPGPGKKAKEAGSKNQGPAICRSGWGILRMMSSDLWNMNMSRFLVICAQTIFGWPRFSRRYPAVCDQHKWAKIFCRIRSYLSTCRKQGITANRALELLFNGGLPEFKTRVVLLMWITLNSYRRFKI